MIRMVFFQNYGLYDYVEQGLHLKYTAVALISNSLKVTQGTSRARRKKKRDGKKVKEPKVSKFVESRKILRT